MHPQITTITEWMASGLGDTHAITGGADVRKKHGSINLFGYRGEVEIVPCWACLAIDAGCEVIGVGTVPAETETVTVEIAGLGRMSRETLACVK